MKMKLICPELSNNASRIYRFSRIVELTVVTVRQTMLCQGTSCDAGSMG